MTGRELKNDILYLSVVVAPRGRVVDIWECFLSSHSPEVLVSIYDGRTILHILDRDTPRYSLQSP